MVKISLNKLSSEHIYVKLNKRFIIFIINLIKKSNTLLNKEIQDKLYRIQRNQKASLCFIKRLSSLLGISLKEFEENIILITSVKNTDIGIKNPRIPFNFNTGDGARFISSIMGHGEINSQIQVRYNNQDKILIGLVLNSAKKIFGNVDYKLYFREDKTYQLHFPKIIGLIMLHLGLKPGYKSKTNYGVPNFIFKSKKQSKSLFLRQFYNDEGSIRLSDRRVQIKQTSEIKVPKQKMKLNIEKYCHNALIDVHKLLLDFDIKSKLSLETYRKPKADWGLSIYGKENLERFQKHIGFDIPYKNRLLKKAIKSYKFPSAPRNGRLEFALEKCRTVQDRYGFITKYTLAKECKRSLKIATYYLIDLKKKEKIKCIETPRNKKGIPSAHKYIIS